MESVVESMNIKFKRIFFKILLIPIVAGVSIVISLVITASTSQKNALLLSEAELIQFPLLNLAQSSLFKYDSLQKQFQSAATTADEDVLESTLCIKDDIV